LEIHVTQETSIESGATRFLRLKQVVEKTGLSRSTVYLYLNQGRFPKPVHVSERLVAWVESEVDAWMKERIAARKAVT
jgi:prophage regulatory protein